MNICSKILVKIDKLAYYFFVTFLCFLGIGEVLIYENLESKHITILLSLTKT